MRFRLLLAFAGVLVVGAALDATVHRDVTGAELPTVGERETAGADHQSERVVPTLAGEAFQQGVPDGRFALYLALREQTPGATVLLDAEIDPGALSALYLRTIAAAGDVRTIDASAVDVPARQPSTSGTFRYGTWNLFVADGTVTDVVLIERHETIHAVDARLVDTSQFGGVPAPTVRSSPAPAVASVRAADDPPGWAVAVAFETLLLGGMLLLGGLLTPREPLPRWGRIAIAGLVGVALHGTLGLLLLPGLWGIVTTAVTAGAAGLLLTRAGVLVGWRRTDIGPLAIIIGGLGVTVLIARATAFLTLTADSFVYWAAGAALADGILGVGDLELKRGVVQASLHAAGFALGIEGVQSIGPAVAFLAAVLLAAAARTTRARALAGLLLLSMLLSSQVQAMTAFLGAHLLVAALLAALVLLVGAARTQGEELAGLPALTVLAAAVVLLRAEGALLVALVLLSVQALAWERPRWSSAWMALGVITTGWAAILSLGQGLVGEGMSVALLLLGLLGIILAGTGLVLAALPSHVRVLLPTAAAILLWVVALWLISRDTVDFVDAIVANVGRGAGGWGVTGPLLMLAAALAVAVTRRSVDPVVHAGRLLVIGFIPLSLLVKLGDGLQDPTADLGLLLEGGGRVGWGDSINRMWMHAVLVVVLLLVRSAASTDDRPAGSSRSRGVRSVSEALSGAALLAFGVIVVVNWQPDFTPGRVTVQDEILRAVDGEAVMAELVDGVTLTQTIILPPTPPDLERPIVGLCLDLPFVTFDRRTVGEVELTVTSGTLTASQVLDARDLADWVPVRTCLELATPEPASDATVLADPLVVTVVGRDAPSGAAVGVLAGPAFGSGATLRNPTDPEGVSRLQGHLVSDVVLQVERQVGLLEAPVERSVRVLPALALLLAVGVVTAGALERRRRSEDRGPRVEA